MKTVFRHTLLNEQKSTQNVNVPAVFIVNYLNKKQNYWLHDKLGRKSDPLLFIFIIIKLK